MSCTKGEEEAEGKRDRKSGKMERHVKLKGVQQRKGDKLWRASAG